MPDISMCQNKDCPKSKQCWRFNAPPSDPYQTYMDFKYDENGCDSFWDMEDR